AEVAFVAALGDREGERGQRVERIEAAARRGVAERARPRPRGDGPKWTGERRSPDGVEVDGEDEEGVGGNRGDDRGGRVALGGLERGAEREIDRPQAHAGEHGERRDRRLPVTS